MNKKILYNWWAGEKIEGFAFIISGFYIDPLNRFVDVSFDPDVYGSAGNPLLASDLQLIFTQNGGNSTACTISSITNTSGGALVGGETTVRVNLSFTGNPSGVETIEIKPSADGSYEDGLGNKCSANDSTGVITVEITLDDMYKAVILAEITASEAIPNRQQREIENAWFVTGRSAGWLSELDGIHLASFNQTHILYNFVTGTKDAAIVGSPVLTPYLGQRGATGGYIDFNWNPSTDGIKHLQDDRSFIVVITNNGQSASAVFGARGTAGGANFGHTRIIPRNTSDQTTISTGINNSGNEIVYSPITDSEGVWMASRNAASGTNAVKLYKDGVELASDIDTSSTPTTRDYFGNTFNPNDGAVTANSVHDCLLWAWGSNLRSHVSSINTASATLKTDLEAEIPSFSGKLYAIIGQSNADRSGLLSELSAGEASIYNNGPISIANGYDANCYIWWDDEWQILEPGVNGVDKTSGGTWFGPIYAIAVKESIKYPGEDLFFLHQAIGGTGMRSSDGGSVQWLPGGTISSMYETFIREYNSATAALTSVSAYMKVFWFQGEADASRVNDSRDYGPIDMDNAVVFSNSATLSAVNGQTSMTTSANHGVTAGQWVGIKDVWYKAITGTTGTTLVIERAYEGVTETVSNADLLKANATGSPNNEKTMMDEIILDTGFSNFIVAQIHDDILSVNYPYKSRIRAQKQANSEAGNYGASGVLINVDDLTFRTGDNPHLSCTSCIELADRVSNNL